MSRPLLVPQVVDSAAHLVKRSLKPPPSGLSWLVLVLWSCQSKSDERLAK